MNTVKYIVIFWAAIALCSCVKKVDTARGLTVDIDVSKADKLQPDEWFETVSYIPLKCPDNTVLGKIERVYSLKDGQFMVYDSKNDPRRPRLLGVNIKMFSGVNHALA